MKTLLSSTAAAVMLATGAATMSAAPASAQDPFLGEMRIMPYTFCPRGWLGAEGQLLPINQNQSLFSLYGTVYGGDGRTSFALPDLRGRSPLGEGQQTSTTSARITGQQTGAETVTLTVAELPAHTHAFRASSQTPDVGSVNGAGWGDFGMTFAAYNSGGQLNEQARSDAITNTGGNQSHNNISPTLVIRYCVATQGVFPSRN
ncbi:MAG: tail fiber protein [Pseudomonadota bacterium]